LTGGNLPVSADQTFRFHDKIGRTVAGPPVVKRIALFRLLLRFLTALFVSGVEGVLQCDQVLARL
jgi:hypothetical protein